MSWMSWLRHRVSGAEGLRGFSLAAAAGETSARMDYSSPVERTTGPNMLGICLVFPDFGAWVV
jgi:hypothetical protein